MSGKEEGVVKGDERAEGVSDNGVWALLTMQLRETKPVQFCNGLLSLRIHRSCDVGGRSGGVWAVVRGSYDDFQRGFLHTTAPNATPLTQMGGVSICPCVRPARV